MGVETPLNYFKPIKTTNTMTANTAKIKRQVTTTEEIEISIPFYYCINDCTYHKVDVDKTIFLTEWRLDIVSCQYISNSNDFRVVSKEEFDNVLSIFKSNMNDILKENTL